MPPTLDTERQLWTQGYLAVCGLDEAGRGCLAGPVVAAAVILPCDPFIPGIDDSKRVPPARRNVLAAHIAKEAVAVGIGQCSPEEIDRLNILWASMEAMRRAVETLPHPPDYLLVDGNHCFPEPRIPYQTLIKGDGRSLTIAAASIIAKTTRDRLMHTLHQSFPEYGWVRNAGYPTPDHYEALARHGPTPHHRHSFKLYR